MKRRSGPSAVRTSPRRSRRRKAALNAVWYRNGGSTSGIAHPAGPSSNSSRRTSSIQPTPGTRNFDIVRNSGALNLSRSRNGSNLLSQTFPEGAPTHPAYPTGHGTVAGACITVLKFFFDGEWTFQHPVVPSTDGLTLDAYPGASSLSVNGELHKLAYNVSFGHGIPAGIHWRSDSHSSIASEKLLLSTTLKTGFTLSRKTSTSR